MLNHKTIFKQKSKILLTIICIFGLILYYGCRSDDGGITDPGTFSISGATGNVVSSIVQSSKTVGDIKIAFAASHAYTMDYTVDDANETVEANKIDKTDFKVENNVLTASESLLTKVRALDSANNPAEKTITINFTFKANDSSLKNNTQTLSVEVKLTHAQKVDDSNIDNAITKILKGIDTYAKTYIERGNVPNKTYATFTYKAGTYATGVYKIKNESMPPIEQFDADNEKDFSDIKTVLDYYLPQIA